MEYLSITHFFHYRCHNEKNSMLLESSERDISIGHWHKIHMNKFCQTSDCHLFAKGQDNDEFAVVFGNSCVRQKERRKIRKYFLGLEKVNKIFRILNDTIMKWETARYRTISNVFIFSKLLLICDRYCHSVENFYSHANLNWLNFYQESSFFD